MKGDVFDEGLAGELLLGEGGKGWDVIVANPPYISPKAFAGEVERSVRNSEPKTALVPSYGNEGEAVEYGGDAFYGRILWLAERVGTRILAMEVADLAQAGRVVGMMGEGWGRREVWRDDLGVLGGRGQSVSNGNETVGANGRYGLKGDENVAVGEEVVVRGQGNGRCVVG